MTRLDTVILFDVEDVFSPPELGNDDSIKELAEILEAEGLRGTFLFIADRAAQLAERGRSDVIAAVARHEIGLHTLSASHPCCPEYVADLEWEEGVEEVLRHERKGTEILERIFDQPVCALSNHWRYTCPQIQHAAARLGLPYIYSYPTAPPLDSLTWYAGALGLPSWNPNGVSKPRTDKSRDQDPEGSDPSFALNMFYGPFDDTYPDNRAFGSVLVDYDRTIDRLLSTGHPFMATFLYHPQRVRLAEFIDHFWSPNGINSPRERWGEFGNPKRYTSEEIQRSLKNFRRIVRFIRDDERLNPILVRDMMEKYGTQPDQVTHSELIAAATEIKAKRQILLHPRFSPAEITVAMASMVVRFADCESLPDSVTRIDVLGPTRSPIEWPEARRISWFEFVSRVRDLLDHVSQTGCLPATLGGELNRTGVNHLTLALAHALLSLEDAVLPETVDFEPMPRYPEIAPEIGRRFLSVSEGELIDPDLNPGNLYRHGKLQTWTMKPALFQKQT
jgi:peptidoglycan/xylan/chitin deacetylase (PgdA/CDA1 family)